MSRHYRYARSVGLEFRVKTKSLQLPSNNKSCIYRTYVHLLLLGMYKLDKSTQII